MIFFDKIAFRVFLFSKAIHKTIFGKGNYIDDAKIQTLFIISLSQSAYVFFIILDFILAMYFETNTPKYINLSGLILFCLYNYSRYYKTNTLQEMETSNTLFLKNKLLTNIIVVLYFIIGIVLFFKIGDMVREIIVYN